MMKAANIKRKRVSPEDPVARQTKERSASYSPPVPAVPILNSKRAIKLSDNMKRLSQRKKESPSRRVDRWLEEVLRERHDIPDFSEQVGKEDDSSDGPCQRTAASDSDQLPSATPVTARDRDTPSSLMKQSMTVDIGAKLSGISSTSCVPQGVQPSAREYGQQDEARDVQPPEQSPRPTSICVEMGEVSNEECGLSDSPERGEEKVWNEVRSPEPAGTPRHGCDPEVRKLSPLVTPFRKGKRPKLQRCGSYYDGDILQGILPGSDTEERTPS